MLYAHSFLQAKQPMASINIYVPDDLKAQMANVEANWSEICRAAIEAELDRLEVAPIPPRRGTADVTNGDRLVSIPVDQRLVAKTAIIKFNDKRYNRVSATVIDIGDWLSKVKGTVRSMSTVGGKISDLLDGRYDADMLLPGEPWRSGHFKLDLKFSFVYSLPEEEQVIVQDVE
ncbi:MAG: hypothetical protein EA367_14920 [Leptolyngbya sp. DLM2.Bin15]|nr:MAG: hypothetical protein EA367_14920 [Leptolyngbya sp. DLM2.Bin15]